MYDCLFLIRVIFIIWCILYINMICNIYYTLKYNVYWAFYIQSYMLFINKFIKYLYDAELFKTLHISTEGYANEPS